MEFLVHMEIALPQQLPREERKRLLEAEANRGAVLRDRGVIKRIWRLPGRWANIGIWDSRDATELHEYITSLPLSAYADVQVTALATHYLERIATA